MKKNALAVAVLICMLNGCSLDEVVEEGEKCPNPASDDVQLGYVPVLGYINDRTCIRGNCSLPKDYTDNFERGVCPGDYPACGKDRDNIWYCSKIVCKTDQHVDNGVCEDDSLENCGRHGFSCQQEKLGWSTGVCREGACIISTCLDGYALDESTNTCIAAATSCIAGQHLDRGLCEADTIENCGSHGYSCSVEKPGWKAGECIDAQCVPTSCQTDYILEDGKCVFHKNCPDNQHAVGDVCEKNSLENCGNHGNNCQNLAGWSRGKCEKGVCVASECEESYHIYDKTCEADDVDNCGKHGSICVTENGEMSCVGRECIISSCVSGYHINDNACVIDDLDNCGAQGYKCETELVGWEEGTCEDGKCIVSKCKDNKHVFENTCEPNDMENCGSHGNKCEQDGAVMSCNAGSCEFTECQSTYHDNDGNTCEINSNENCGGHGNVCETDNGKMICDLVEGVCKLDVCDDNYHEYNKGCEANDNANCGQHENACETADGVMSCDVAQGVCVLDSCNVQYHKNGLTCEINSNDNCGEHGNKCVTSNGTMSCDTSAGKCELVSCDEGYHAYENACEADTVDNCGAHGTKCELANGTPACVDRVCVIDTCDMGYHTYLNKSVVSDGIWECEANGNTHCGAHGRQCVHKQSTWVYCTVNKGICEDGGCREGYHMEAIGCVAN